MPVRQRGTGRMDTLIDSGPRLDPDVTRCQVCHLPIAVGDWPCISRVRRHAPALRNVPPFVAYFDIGLGRDITSFADRWRAMRELNVVDRPKLRAGDLSARRDKIEEGKKERQQWAVRRRHIDATASSSRAPSLITDHAYTPCFYDTLERREMGEALRLCLSPGGMDRCHKSWCFRRRRDHATAADEASRC